MCFEDVDFVRGDFTPKQEPYQRRQAVNFACFLSPVQNLGPYLFAFLLCYYFFAVGYRSKFAGTPKTKSRVKSELKHPLDILKQRKVREKNKLRHQLGNQRRKAKNEKASKKSKKKGRIKRI